MGGNLGARRLIGAAGLAVLLASCGRGAAGSAAPTSTARQPGRGAVPTATTQALRLPAFQAAEDAACDLDFNTLRTAENLYATVNGTYASLGRLVAEQYLRTASTYYVDVKIGTPIGGFTLIAAPDGPCASLPVRDSR